MYNIFIHTQLTIITIITNLTLTERQYKRTNASGWSCLAIFLSRHLTFVILRTNRWREIFVWSTEREKKGGKKKRIQWRAMAAFINGGHQPVRCPRFRLSAKGGSIFINAWHLDSYFKYTPSEYHEFVFNKSADEWAHRFWLPPCYRNRAPVNKRFSFFLEPTPIAFSSSPLESFSSLFFLENCNIISKTPLPRFRNLRKWELTSEELLFHKEFGLHCLKTFCQLSLHFFFLLLLYTIIYTQI